MGHGKSQSGALPSVQSMEFGICLGARHLAWPADFRTVLIALCPTAVALVALVTAALLALPFQAILVLQGTLWCDAP